MKYVSTVFTPTCCRSHADSVVEITKAENVYPSLRFCVPLRARQIEALELQRPHGVYSVGLNVKQSGEKGIRTLGDIPATLDFESSALDQLSHLSMGGG